MTEPLKLVPGRKREREKRAEDAEHATPVTLILTIHDRIVLPSLFPEKGNYMVNLLMEDIGGKVRIGQQEAREVSLKSTVDARGMSRTEWKDSPAREKSFEFTSAEIAFLKQRVEHLNSTEEIRPDLMPLIKKVKAL